MKNSRKGFAFLLSCVWAARCMAAASQEPPVDLLAKTHLGGGLIIHVGATDGRIETRLAQRGVYLVHGLALDDEACGAAGRGSPPRACTALPPSRCGRIGGGCPTPRTLRLP